MTFRLVEQWLRWLLVISHYVCGVHGMNGIPERRRWTWVLTTPVTWTQRSVRPQLYQCPTVVVSLSSSPTTPKSWMGWRKWTKSGKDLFFCCLFCFSGFSFFIDQFQFLLGRNRMMIIKMESDFCCKGREKKKEWISKWFTELAICPCQVWRWESEGSAWLHTVHLYPYIYTY